MTFSTEISLLVATLVISGVLTIVSSAVSYAVSRRSRQAEFSATKCTVIQLEEALSEISGAYPAQCGEPCGPGEPATVNPPTNCEYCRRPNLNRQETCQGCGAPTRWRGKITT